jgi:hypothetical protein
VAVALVRRLPLADVRAESKTSALAIPTAVT